MPHRQIVFRTIANGADRIHLEEWEAEGAPVHTRALGWAEAVEIHRAGTPVTGFRTVRDKLQPRTADASELRW